MIKYLIAFLLIASPCLAGMGIGGFPQPGPGVVVGANGAAYTDDFNRADENPIGSPWVAVSTGTIRLTNNALGTTTNTEELAHHNGSLANNQYATVKILGAVNGSGVGVRMDSARSNDARKGYTLSVHDGSLLVLRKWLDGSFLNLRTYEVSAASGDILRIEANGTSIKGFYNGVERISVTDSTYTSGYAGVMVQNAYETSIDDFASGDL